MRVCAIVQARMSSSRFPGKMMATLRDRPVILHTLQAAARANSVDGVIMATSTDPSDDPLAELAEEMGFQVYRGSLERVCERVYEASDGYDAVVRITGDCPYTRPDVVDDCVAEFLHNDLDYVSNTLPPTYPDGQDVEVIRRTLLADNAGGEHVTTHVRSRLHEYKWANVENGIDYSGMSCAVDHPDDITSKGIRVKQRNDAMVEPFLEELDAIPRPKLTKQKKAMEKLRDVIPGGAQTFSKMPHRWGEGFGPMVMSHASGAKVIDLDGNVYIDYVLGLGPVTVGHHQLRPHCAASHSHPTMVEYELAEKLLGLYPGMDMVRFFKNGSDATAAAVRLARHITGKKRVVSYGYHGAQDWCCTEGPLSSGSIGSDIDHVDHISSVADAVNDRNDAAGAILEPANQQTMTPLEHQQLGDKCREKGTLLIYDEVVTWPRVGWGGCAEYYRTQPDLVCIGKGMANGAPISALLGKREHMERFTDIFYSTTFGGELGAMRTALECIDTLIEGDYPAMCRRKGNAIKTAYNETVDALHLGPVTECVGEPWWPIVTFRDAYRYTSQEYFTFFQQEVLRRGILFNGNHFFCLRHRDEHISHTTSAYKQCLILLRRALDYKILNRVTIGKTNTGGVRRA